MRCKATTTAGKTCSRDGFEDYPMCKQHIRIAMEDILRGEGKRQLWSIEARSEPLYSEEEY